MLWWYSSEDMVCSVSYILFNSWSKTHLCFKCKHPRHGEHEETRSETQEEQQHLRRLLQMEYWRTFLIYSLRHLTLLIIIPEKELDRSIKFWKPEKELRLEYLESRFNNSCCLSCFKMEKSEFTPRNVGVVLGVEAHLVLILYFVVCLVSWTFGKWVSSVWSKWSMASSSTRQASDSILEHGCPSIKVN